MCLLHFGQIVEDAAELISCVAPQSKQSMTELVGLFQRPSNLRKIDGVSATDSTGSDAFGRRRSSTLGASGTKWEPHWRHIVLLAAAYSICLKPQCGQSTLILAGDGLATVFAGAKGGYLTAGSEGGFGRRRRCLFVPDNFRPGRRGILTGCAGGDF